MHIDLSHMVRKLLPALLTAIITISMTMQSHASSLQTNVEVYFLDVGQGDAMIIHQPGICTTLIDAGPLIHGYRVTRKLQALGVKEIDNVIITHPHLDHFGGLFDIDPRIEINQFYDNGHLNAAVEYFDDYLVLRSSHTYTRLSTGDEINCGDVNLQVLEPAEKQPVAEHLNRNSLAFMISAGSTRILHMGDLSGEAELAFLKRHNDIQADIIKIAHHGADDATSAGLLERVKPELAVISVARENRYNSPSPRVLKRLKKREIDIHQTSAQQTLGLTITSNGYAISE